VEVSSVAPRKKPYPQRGAQSPNTVLVIFLIFFVLATVITGVLAYYGYMGQDKLKKDAKEAEAKVKGVQKAEQWKEFQALLTRMALGDPFFKDDNTDEANNFAASLESFDTAKGTLKEDDTKFKDEKNRAVVEAMFKKCIDQLGWDGKKFKTNYRDLTAKLDREMKRALADYATTLEQKEKLKDEIEKLAAARKAFYEQANEAIKKGNDKALAAALEQTKQIGELLKVNTDLNEKLKEAKEKFEQDLLVKDKQINEVKTQLATARKELQAQAEAAAGPGAPSAKSMGQPHALLLDVSQGRLMWDRPRARVTRIDPTGRKVYLDKGRNQGFRPQLTFAVFAAGAKDRARGRIKGTVEVQEVSDNSSVAWITSIFDDEGEEVPLIDARRGTLLRQGSNPIREGDLLFNPAWGAHVAIAGSVTPSGLNAGSPAEQMRQLRQFMTLLGKEGATVDAYLDLSDGTLKGAITPQTNFLIKGVLARGDAADAGSSKAAAALNEAAKTMVNEAVANGAFIISLDNFLTVIGYRPPPGAAEMPVHFRPSLPTAGTGLIEKTLGGQK
jgi:hypothetical protein